MQRALYSVEAKPNCQDQDQARDLSETGLVIRPRSRLRLQDW